MTTLSTTQIPSNINTVEKLLLWGALLLQKNNPTLAVVETANTNPEKVAQVAMIRADDDTIRAILRLSIPIDPNYASNTAKFWENALELANIAIPTSFETD